MVIQIIQGKEVQVGVAEVVLLSKALLQHVPQVQDLLVVLAHRVHIRILVQITTITVAKPRSQQILQLVLRALAGYISLLDQSIKKPYLLPNRPIFYQE